MNKALDEAITILQFEMARQIDELRSDINELLDDRLNESMTLIEQLRAKVE